MRPTDSGLDSRVDSQSEDAKRIRGKVVRRELIIGFSLTFLGLVVLLLVIPLGVKVPGHLPEAATSPAMWPKATALLLTGAGIAYSVLVLLDHYRSGPVPSSLPEPMAGSWHLIIAALGLFACVALLPVLGLPVVSGLALAAYALLLKAARVWLIATMAILLPTALYLFFTRVANIPIPLGTLFR